MYRDFIDLRVFLVLKIIILLLYSNLFVFKCLFTITKENYLPLFWRICLLKLDFKNSMHLKGFFNLFVFGFTFTMIKKNFDLLW